MYNVYQTIGKTTRLVRSTELLSVAHNTVQAMPGCEIQLEFSADAQHPICDLGRVHERSRTIADSEYTLDLGALSLEQREYFELLQHEALAPISERVKLFQLVFGDLPDEKTDALIWMRRVDRAVLEDGDLLSEVIFLMYAIIKEYDLAHPSAPKKARGQLPEVSVEDLNFISGLSAASAAGKAPALSATSEDVAALEAIFAL